MDECGYCGSEIRGRAIGFIFAGGVVYHRTCMDEASEEIEEKRHGSRYGSTWSGISRGCVIRDTCDFINGEVNHATY